MVGVYVASGGRPTIFCPDARSWPPASIRGKVYAASPTHPMTAPETLDTLPGRDRKPRDDEIDVHGLSHCGKVRQKNEDHFLLASVHKRVQVLSTNLSDLERLPLADQRLTF